MAVRTLLVAALVAVVSPSFGATSKFLCTNRDTFSGPVLFKLNVRSGTLSYKTASCPVTKIEYNPNSPKYEGWIRLASFAKNEAACTKFGSAVVGSKEKIRFEWISVSKEMQGGADGFAQFGYQNIWDPGAGGTAKLFVRCRATN
jgi:hypothetical protein